MVCRWPNTSCQVTARYYKAGCDYEDENGTGGVKVIHKFETQTLSSLRMKLSDNNTSVAAQSSSITMKASSPVSSCAISSTEGTGPNFSINYSITPPTPTQPSPFTLDLTFEPQSAPFKFNDGKIHFGATRSDGFIEMKFIPDGKCSGIIQIDGELFDFKGHGMCLRQFQGVRPHVTTKRWNCAYFVEKCVGESTKSPRSLYMIQLQCSAAYNDEIVHYGYYFDGKRLNAVTSPANEIIYAKTEIDSETGYPIPEHFDYRWIGADFEGNPFNASISGTPSSRMARIDLLENLPVLIRRIVEGFSAARPYVYQHFDQEMEANVNGEIIKGYLFQEFSFLLENNATKK